MFVCNRKAKSGENMLFVCDREAKSGEFMLFVTGKLGLVRLCCL